MPLVMASDALVTSMHEHINTHEEHTSTHSCVACWQVVHARGNTSLPSTNSPSRLSTSAASNWSTYAEGGTMQTTQHPSWGSKGTNSVCTLKTPRSSLLQCVWNHSWANNRDWPGQTAMRWIKHLMTYSFVKTRLSLQPCWWLWGCS